MTSIKPQGPQDPPALHWQKGIVERVAVETYRVKTFTLRLDHWRSFRPGQHYDIRLTAPDGYQTQRSYSIASAPETEGTIDLTIELVPEGEVSPYFHEVVRPEDKIELRGPIGGPFTWTRDMGGPLLLVGGGSGIVPLMSMLRHRGNSKPGAQALLLYSSRSVDDIIYRKELEEREAADFGLTVKHTLTRSQPVRWAGHARRVDRVMLGEALSQLEGMPHAYVCGSTAFVEVVADALVSLEIPPGRIKTERFGPSG